MLQVLLPTEWRRKAASERIRIALQAQSADSVPGGGEWRYYVELPSLKQHQNHFDTTESKVEQLSMMYIATHIVYKVEVTYN